MDRAADRSPAISGDSSARTCARRIPRSSSAPGPHRPGALARPRRHPRHDLEGCIPPRSPASLQAGEAFESRRSAWINGVIRGSVGQNQPVDSGERIIAGRYRLHERLGSGGMGTVWRGEDVVLGRQVAVKEVTFPPGVSDEALDMLRERTRREARAAAQLDHPGVVTVHDVVEEGVAIYLVMQYVPARTLSEVISRDGPLSPQHTARVGLAVLDALRAAHARGIVHRDVKPSNVLMCLPSEDAVSRVVLTDFGIASAPGDSRLTSTGMVLGSPGYIAPERAQGDVPVPASDLWSLGATLFTAVEGHPPYDAGDPMATLTAIMVGEHAPFVRAGPLEPVLRGLLERDPCQRLTAAEAASLLGELARSSEDAAATARLAVPAGAVNPGASAGTIVLPVPPRPPVVDPASHAAPTANAVRAAAGPAAVSPVRPLRPRLQPRRPRRLPWAAVGAAAVLVLAVPLVRAAGEDSAQRGESPPVSQASPQPTAVAPALPPLPATAKKPAEQLQVTVTALGDLVGREADAAGPDADEALFALRRAQGLDGAQRRSAAIVAQTQVAASVSGGRLDGQVGQRLQDVLAAVARPERLVDLVSLVDVDEAAIGPGGPQLFRPLFELDHVVPADRTAAAASALVEMVRTGARQGQLSQAFAMAALPMLEQLTDPAPYRALRTLVSDAERDPRSVGPARRQVLASLREMTTLPVFPQANKALELLDLARQDGQVSRGFRDRASPVLDALVR